jgi:hypothetical protein
MPHKDWQLLPKKPTPEMLREGFPMRSTENAEFDYQQLLKTAPKYVKQPKARNTCHWRRNGDSFDGYHWETECGQTWEFTVDGPAENNCKFCMYCGGVLTTLREK